MPQWGLYSSFVLKIKTLESLGLAQLAKAENLLFGHKFEKKLSI